MMMMMMIRPPDGSLFYCHIPTTANEGGQAIVSHPLIQEVTLMAGCQVFVSRVSMKTLGKHTFMSELEFEVDFS